MSNTPQTDTPQPWAWRLWEHMYAEHGLVLTESELEEVIHISRSLKAPCPECNGSGHTRTVGRDNDEIILDCTTCNDLAAANARIAELEKALVETAIPVEALLADMQLAPKSNYYSIEIRGHVSKAVSLIRAALVPAPSAPQSP